MMHDPLLPPTPDEDEACVPASSEEGRTTRELDDLAVALAEVDSIVAWSDEGGWSHSDLAQVIRVDDGLDEDDDEEPVTVRSPSGIRLSLEHGRPVAVAEDESSPRAIDGSDDDPADDERVA